MDKLNIGELVATMGLTPSEVAAHLFPENKHAVLAFRRVTKGLALLDSEQLQKLAALAGVTVGEIFQPRLWTCKSRGTAHTFTNEDYDAVVNMEEGKLTIFHKKSLFHTKILHSKAIPLSELLGVINNQIKEYEFKN